MTKFEYLIKLLENNEELEEIINNQCSNDAEVEYLANEMCGPVDDYFYDGEEDE